MQDFTQEQLETIKQAEALYAEGKKEDALALLKETLDEEGYEKVVKFIDAMEKVAEETNAAAEVSIETTENAVEATEEAPAA